MNTDIKGAPEQNRALFADHSEGVRIKYNAATLCVEMQYKNPVTNVYEDADHIDCTFFDTWDEVLDEINEQWGINIKNQSI